MRTRLLLVLSVVVMMIGCKKDDNNTAQGPEAPTDTWIKVIEMDSSSEYISDMVEATDGGIVLTGYSNHPSAEGNYTIKLNSQGDTLWSRHYAVNGASDIMNGIVALPDGGTLAIGEVSPTGHDHDEALLIRSNESGGVVWQRITNNPVNSLGFAGARCPDGSFIIAAGSMFLKLNSNGDTLWTKMSNGATMLGVIALSDDGAILSGYITPTNETYPGYVMRCDAQGDTLWTREFPIASMRMYPWDITRTGDGDYVVVAEYDGPSPENVQGTWAAKISESGQVRWSNTYGEDAYFRRVAIGSDGLPVIVGTLGSAGTGRDILLMKLDNSGNEVWTRTYLTALDEVGYAITATSDGGFVIAGTIAGVPYADIIVIKVNADGEI